MTLSGRSNNYSYMVAICIYVMYLYLSYSI